MREVRSDSTVPRTRRALAILVALVLTALAVACTSPTHIDQAAATQIAQDFFAAGHGSGATVTNVKVLSIDQGTDAARPVWKVNISGDVTEAGRSSPSYTSYEWLYVYADTGEVRVFAQG